MSTRINPEPIRPQQNSDSVKMNTENKTTEKNNSTVFSNEAPEQKNVKEADVVEMRKNIGKIYDDYLSKAKDKTSIEIVEIGNMLNISSIELERGEIDKAFAMIKEAEKKLDTLKQMDETKAELQKLQEESKDSQKPQFGLS